MNRRLRNIKKTNKRSFRVSYVAFQILGGGAYRVTGLVISPKTGKYILRGHNSSSRVIDLEG